MESGNGRSAVTKVNVDKVDEVEAIRAGRLILDEYKQSEHDNRLRVAAELLATENLMIPVRFWFMTPDHAKLVAFKIHEVYTGLRGRRRIKLVDDVGRVFHYDRDLVVFGGLARDAAA